MRHTPLVVMELDQALLLIEKERLWLWSQLDGLYFSSFQSTASGYRPKMHTCMGFQNKLTTASNCQELPEFYRLLDNMLPVTLVKTYYFLVVNKLFKNTNFCRVWRLFQNILKPLHVHVQLICKHTTVLLLCYVLTIWKIMDL